MKLKINFEGDAVISLKQVAPTLVLEFEKQVHSFNSNVDNLHGRALSTCPNAVNFVLDRYMDSVVEWEDFYESFQFYIRDFVRNALLDYRLDKKEPETVSFAQEKRIRILIGTLYHVILLKKELPDYINLRDIVSLE